MKVRVTLMTSNDAPVSALGDDPEKKVKQAWDAVAEMLSLLCNDGIYVEKVEVADNDQL